MNGHDALGRPAAGRGPSRRRVLAGGAAALAVAAAAPARAIGRLAAGEGELIVIADGSMSLPVGFSFPDNPAAKALLAEHGLPTDTLTNDCNVTLLRGGDRLAIFDVGAGPNFMATTGRLLDGLAEAGIDPADVTDVVFTHAHPDHLWGVTDDFDELVFANAAYRIGRAEWDFWSSPGTVDALPEDRKTFAVGAQNRFAAIADRVSFFEAGEEVLPGVEAVDTRGHTPGHMSFMVHGGGEPVLVGGDAITNAVVSFARPDWPFGTDHDAGQGARTRVALLDRLAGERARLIGYHLPHPGAGTVERRDGAYRWAPA